MTLDISALDEITVVPVIEYSNQVSSAPQVSICVQTYQHEPYIVQCIESILGQIVDFSIEILIAEDCSADSTRELCIELANKYPESIRLFLHNRANNMVIAGRPTGRFPLIHNLLSARGKYIALLDGDDYWINVNKLKSQKEWMDNHPACTVCFHNSLRGRNESEAQLFSFEENRLISLLEGYYFAIGHTSSMFFRRSAGIPVEVLKVSAMGDWPLKLHLLSLGNGYYMKDLWSFYRVHDGSIYTATSAESQLFQSLETFDLFTKHFLSESVPFREVKRTYSKMSDKAILTGLSNRSIHTFFKGILWSLSLFPMLNMYRITLHLLRIKKIAYPDS